jgi:hypothetical protein
MYPAPVHRRIVLWTFIVAFAVVAPAVVFYTSGYRWNAKKGVVERNATLIVDSVPSGASVVLNGIVTHETTPITLQDVTPGTYRIRIEKDGYFPWEKTLEVRPERVTFITNLWLWPRREPDQLTEETTIAMALSWNERVLAALETTSSGSVLLFRDATTLKNIAKARIPGRVVWRNPRLRWNRASSTVLIQDGERAWAVSYTNESGTVIALPDGTYRWSGGALIGVRGGVQYIYTVASGAVARSVLPPFTLDEEDVFMIRTSTETRRIVLRDRNHPEREVPLPDGVWHFTEPQFYLLGIASETRWIGLDPAEREVELVELPADEVPLPLERARGAFLLSAHGNEVWMARLGSPPELLLRKSIPIRGIAWHTHGDTVFIATEHDLIALELDSRDGRRETVLATFSSITSMVAGDGVVYLSGVRRGKSGIWRIPLET